MIVAIMTTALAGTAWADEVVAYTLAPASGSNNSYAGNCDITINNITWNLTGNSTYQPWRIGGKSLNGVDRTLYSKTAITDNVSKIEVTHGAASSITVNSWTVIVSKNSDFSNPVSTLTPTFEASKTTTITRPDGVDWSNCYYKFVYNVTVSGTSNKFVEFAGAKFYTQSAASYTITAASNNNDWGTVSLSGNVITAAPATGYTYADPAYTVTGTATVSQNGNEFTVSASSDCTVTINFMAKPTVSGYDVDFEYELDAYTDWTFTNAEQGTGDITAHGGTYYATTGGKTTAEFQTKEKVDYPDVFTCYVSKASGNTTASNWVVEVSSNGSDWTEVATQDAKSMEKGEWVEFTADIKAAGYTNVYVRLYYSGTTAVRTVDDISLTTYTPAAIEAPSINVPEEFTISTTATITCVTEGATIYYSFDNSTWAEYTDALTITETKTIYAKAVKGSDESAIVSATTTKVLATPNVTISATSFDVGATATVTTDGPAVTLTTSDTSIASVSGTTVTGVAAGTATITATWAATADYSAGTKDFVVTVTDPNAPGSVNNPYTVAQALAVIDGLEDGAKTDNEVYVAGTITQIDEVNTTQYYNATYWISNDGGTTKLEVFRGKYLEGANFTSEDQIKVNDQVVVYGKLQKYVKDEVVTPEVAQGNYIYSLQRPAGAPTVTIGTQTNVASVEMWIGDNDLTDIVDGAEVEEGTVVFVKPTAAEGYEIENVTVEAANSTPVTVTKNTGNWSFVMPNSSVTVNITAVQSSVTPPTGDQYALATSITSGKTYVIANADGTKVMGKTQNNNNRAAVDATLNGTTLTAADACEFTVVLVEEGKYSFYDAVNDGYLYAASSSSNHLKTQSTLDDNGKWTIEIDEEGVASVVAQGTNSRNVMQYNNGSTLFACYGSASQTAIKLYEKVEAVEPITVSLNAYGYATFASTKAIDFTDATDYTAWQITGVNEGAIVFAPITGAVAAGTGVLLKGTESQEITLTEAETGTDISSTNKLVGFTVATNVQDNQYYGLKNDKFVKVNAGQVPAGKALLPVSAMTSGVKAFTFVFDDDATGISTVESFTEEGAIYNLAGQRLQKMQKGINIVNGKKILK